MADVVVQDAKRDAFERRRDGRDLRQDVDAVAIFLDHPLEAPHLALDPVQALDKRILVVPVRGHAAASLLLWKRLSRSEFVTTKTLEKAIAAAATIGFRSPAT